MKIQKDIQTNVVSKQLDIIKTPVNDDMIQPIDVQPDTQLPLDIQQTVDSIFEEADVQMLKNESKLAGVHPRVNKWTSKISWSIIGFIAFVIIGMGFMGYKTYQYAKNHWPGIREEAINRYQELQNELTSIDDSNLTAEAYYQKQYMLVLSAEDIRNIAQLGLTVQQVQQLKEMVESNTTTNISLFEILPEEKAMQFIRIMVAEKKYKDLGEIVYVDTITDADIQQFLTDSQQAQQEVQENESN